MGSPVLAALSYARRGWRVFPCHTPVPGGCTCPAGTGCASVGKHPRTRHGLHDASADADTIKRWWRTWPQANLGIRTGDGLGVVDVDPAHGGMASLAALEAAMGRMPQTLSVRTGGAGLHLYFSVGEAIGNSAGALGPGIDVRGDGGYVIAPPSWHASGSWYRSSGGATLAPLPGWVREHLVRPEPERVALDPGDLRRPGVSAWAATALAGEVARINAAADGRRNHTLNRSAFVLGQIVAGGHLDRAEVVDVLRRAGESAGLGPREVAATLDSGLNAGERWPRHPPDRPLPPGRAGAHVDLRSVALPASSDRPRRDQGVAEGLSP
ncbi:MAG: bifunctional DNA primase/polymerase [Acidimicrobiales bacterium]